MNNHSLLQPYHIVVVLDLSNYKREHAETVPFPAKVEKIDGYDFWVRSIVTNTLYEVDKAQLLEYLSIKEIRLLINLQNYGADV
jgi:hypothetical protein